MSFKRLSPAPRPIEGDPCTDPRVDCTAYRAAVAAASGKQPSVPPAASPSPPAAPLAHPRAATVARNAAGAIARIAGAAVSGKRVRVELPEHERRMAICKACPYLAASGGRCTKCGCFTGLKTQFATERCPDGRW